MYAPSRVWQCLFIHTLTNTVVPHSSVFAYLIGEKMVSLCRFFSPLNFLVQPVEKLRVRE